MDRRLSVSMLLERGFTEFDCWTASEARINPPIDLPAQRGVYAFALGEQIVYVGLASRSVRQRLGFYARPGASQVTNVRLNGIIRELIRQGQTVRILIAHPGDGEWNGWRISGPEGLESALIEDYNLPWNVRGSKTFVPVPQAAPAKPRKSTARAARGSRSQEILDFVLANPNCTELQIAKGVFGPAAVQPQANTYCRKLVEQRVLDRLPTRPVTYVAKAQG